MAGSRTLKLSILADVDELKKSLDKGSNEVQTFGDKMAKFGKMAAAAFAAAAVAAAAFAVKFAKDAIVAAEAAATANARINQINESMGLFGESTKVVSDRLIALAEATARNTGVDTNSIKLTQAKLLTFKELAATAGEVGGQFDRATKAAIDMASAGFGEASANAVQLGKALNDPIKGITALTRSGITFTESEKERIAVLVQSNQIGEAQKMVLAAIETQVGGTAEATANATDRMKVGWQQVQEKVGMKLLPVLDQLTNFLFDKIFPAFDKFTAQLSSGQGLGGAFTDLIDIIRKIFIPVFNGIVSAFNSIKAAIGDNLETFKTFGGYIQTYLAPIVGTVLGGALTVVGKIAGGVITVIADVIKVINGLVGGAIDGINALIRAYNAIPLLPNIPTISKPTLTAPSVTVPKTVTPTVPSITVPTITAPTTSAAGAGTSSGVAKAATTGAAAATAAAALVPTVTIGGAPAGYTTETFTPTATLGGAPASYVSNTVNIGVAGDPQGTANAVIDILNQSFERIGTGKLVPVV